MPEFEEPEAAPSPKQNYTPSVDASDKPRTRRRSGGFKTTPAATNSSIGEVDPAEALKKEKLSGGAKPEPKAKKEKPAPKAEKPKAKPEKSGNANPQPSPETLAAIKRVDARLAERKKERDARRAEKEKNRPAKSGKKPAGKQKGGSKQAQSGGLIASILNFFGLGPKQPAKKQGGRGKPSGKGGQGGRPRGKGGNRGQGQNRRGGGGKGRRSSSGGGGKGQRRSNNRRSPGNNS
ncbi:hypothetical protein DDZ13_01795 [Coraliomargarita sinensis]|uniref:Uncharacterized protein n=1 Tax=Coraliomargarita sinensis TaxID=2174842 RepID=A0A317ZQD7_9BACT|nr:hypothetical protein [Coraliomargarita sinensis]PXA05631.1 hypothetical protein DDZ13_01795 [Coraliomargarita sinensis]